ncbi:MAG: transcription antitermination factor NusB [Prolixibacteraceae bacterium]|nr:transcription antitermination factor NusB [Prolixibacteraceae bacterium]
MISRRIIRIKVMQALYAFHSSPDQTINLAEKELFFSINKSYDLYHWMLQLLVEIHQFSLERLEIKKQKNLPTSDDLNPNTRFIENPIILKIIENKPLQKYLEQSKLSWHDYPELIKKLHTELIESEQYTSYMSSANHTLKDDYNLIEYFYANIVVQSEDLYQLLEEQSIYWNDDLEFVASMIIKTLRKFKLSTLPTKSLMPLFKDEDDIDFTKKLFRKAVLNTEEHREIIKKHLRNWELDRVAFIDVLIMEMALCEFLYFNSIPTKVSLNEYIDLAKFYSTTKSRTFINGILDKILKSLKEEGQITKIGRGLVGEDDAL